MTLETIRQACIDSNPEIVELKFGCEVTAGVWEEWDRFVVLQETGICNRHKKTHETCYDPDGKCTVDDGYWLYYYSDDGSYDVNVLKEKIKEVHGRPIHLADVLLAIEKQNRKGLVSPNLKRNSELHEMTDVLNWWNLREDNLESQSPETIKFLSELLTQSDKRG